jgi:hypothetical protein
MLDGGLAALLEKSTSCHSEESEESGFFASKNLDPSLCSE